MKCLIVCNYFQPKIPYAESQIAHSLVKLGHQVELITGDRYFPFPNYSETVESILGPRQLKPGGYKESGLTVQRNKILFELFARSFYGGVQTKINSYKPDVVLVFGLSTPASVQVAWAKLSGSYKSFRFIGIDSHLPSEFNSGSRLLKQAFYFVFRTLFSSLLNSQLDKAIAVQEGTIEIITQYYGIHKNVQLVSHGTDTESFRFDAVAGEKVRTQNKIAKNDFVIIYTGKIIPAKGVDILIKAFQLLCKKHGNLKLLLVGAGPKEYLNQLFTPLSEEQKEKIIVTGFKDHTVLYTFYSAADVAVWPLQESMAMIDAASCQLPFIANHTLGAKERVANDNAILYNQNDYQDLATKIEQLYLDGKLRKDMGKRGRALVEKSFSWQKVAQRYLA